MTNNSRRKFLKTAGMLTGGVALFGLAGCAGKENNTPAPTPAPAPASHGNHKDWQEMDRLHKEGLEIFPAPTEGKGNQPMPYTMDGDVKVFHITCSEIEWEVTPGVKVKAMAYNGTVPGPMIRVTEGDKCRFIVKNEMSESTGVHWHGLRIPNPQDGVPFLTMDPIVPGGTHTYEFVAKPAGSHMYHSHHNAAYQATMGLLGAFIVDPADASKEPEVDHDYLMIIGDGYLGYHINGKGFPATEPIVVKKNDKLRIRFMNMGSLYHPMHLHGFHMEIIARDGIPLDYPFKCDTISVAPGERWDAIVDCDEPGAWAFHCHVLSHAESDHGMFGMVTALIVEE